MTDFVGRVLRPEKNDWIVRSLLDVDFYKFTMAYFIWNFYRDKVNVKFSLINRNKRLPLAKLIDEGELRKQLDHVRSLCFLPTDIYYLRGQDIYKKEQMFPNEFLEFLSKLKMTPYNLERKGEQFELSFEGPWEVVTFWETIALAIICELLYRKLMSEMNESELEALYADAKSKLDKKLRRIAKYPSIKFADFGQRRRHSFLWQQYAIKRAREIVGANFTGTSNTWMAFNQNLTAIGTNAHELPMVLTAIAPSDEAKKAAQYKVLSKWGALFPENALRIVLPDTYGSAQFWRDMPDHLADEIAHNWRGVRQDSGDPLVEAYEFIEWLFGHGVDAMKEGKVVIPSDGLDVTSRDAGSCMIDIDKSLNGKINHAFGWGTNFSNGFAGCHPRGGDQAVIDGVPLIGLTNDDLFRGQSLVIKVESANGQGAVKLSNNIQKATGRPEDIAEYVRIFGSEGQISQNVSV